MGCVQQRTFVPHLTELTWWSSTTVTIDYEFSTGTTEFTKNIVVDETPPYFVLTKSIQRLTTKNISTTQPFDRTNNLIR